MATKPTKRHTGSSPFPDAHWRDIPIVGIRVIDPNHDGDFQVEEDEDGHVWFTRRVKRKGELQESGICPTIPTYFGDKYQVLNLALVAVEHLWNSRDSSCAPSGTPGHLPSCVSRATVRSRYKAYCKRRMKCAYHARNMRLHHPGILNGN